MFAVVIFISLTNHFSLLWLNVWDSPFHVSKVIINLISKETIIRRTFLFVLSETLIAATQVFFLVWSAKGELPSRDGSSSPLWFGDPFFPLSFCWYVFLYVSHYLTICVPIDQICLCKSLFLNWTVWISEKLILNRRRLWDRIIWA